MNSSQIVKTLLEGFWELQQTKHIVSNNIELTFEKYKKAFNFNHNYTRSHIKELNDKRLKALLDSADSEDSLERLINQLNKWINANPKMKKIIDTAGDSKEITNHNQGVSYDVYTLNKHYENLARKKLSKVQKET